MMMENFKIFTICCKNNKTQDTYYEHVASKKELTNEQVIQIADWKNRKKRNHFIISSFDFNYKIVDMFSQILNTHSPFFIGDDYDTIYLKYIAEQNNQDKQDEEDDKHMSCFNVNWNNHTEKLVEKAATENWSNETYPNNGILANYLLNTFRKVQEENKIISENGYSIFNTGLYTADYEPIYAYQYGSIINYYTDYELGKMHIRHLPERANYFEKPDLLLFDPQYEINVQYFHILAENRNIDRVPEEIRSAKNLLAIIIGSIEITKMKLSMNYKLAVPQYYNGQIQLLLPLYLLGNDTPDLALAVTKMENYYQGHTCLTLDMAYNNARLITKPESNWLSVK